MLSYSQVGDLASAVKAINILATFITTLGRSPIYKTPAKEPRAGSVLGQSESLQSQEHRLEKACQGDHSRVLTLLPPHLGQPRWRGPQPQHQGCFMLRVRAQIESPQVQGHWVWKRHSHLSKAGPQHCWLHSFQIWVIRCDGDASCSTNITLGRDGVQLATELTAPGTLGLENVCRVHKAMHQHCCPHTFLI